MCKVAKTKVAPFYLGHGVVSQTWFVNISAYNIHLRRRKKKKLWEQSLCTVRPEPWRKWSSLWWRWWTSHNWTPRDHLWWKPLQTTGYKTKSVFNSSMPRRFIVFTESFLYCICAFTDLCEAATAVLLLPAYCGTVYASAIALIFGQPGHACTGLVLWLGLKSSYKFNLCESLCISGVFDLLQPNLMKNIRSHGKPTHSFLNFFIEWWH